MAFQRISDKKKRMLFSCFKNGLAATQTSGPLNLNGKTMNRCFNLLRKEIFSESAREAKAETGECELDESHFGAKRTGGKRGRGAAGKTPAFGLLKRGEKVFVTIAPNCPEETLMPMIKGLILEKPAIRADGWKAYDGLVLNGYGHHRVFHGENGFARGKSHADGIENFRSFAKGRLAKSNGCSSDNFICHLKECEWRHDHRHEDLRELIKKLYDNTRKKPAERRIECPLTGQAPK